MSAFDEACRAMLTKQNGRPPCPHCKDERQQEYLGGGVWLCSNCAKTFAAPKGTA